MTSATVAPDAVCDPAAHTPRRTLALWIPDWPVLAIAREGLADIADPIVLLHRERVVALSATARGAGVRRGMKRRSAREACPEAILMDRHEGLEVRAFEPILLALEQVMAQVEVIRPGLVIAPARGASRYHGGDARLSHEVIGRITALTGLECQVGIADGMLGALLAARAGVAVPPGETPGFLATLPLRWLTLTLGGETLGAGVRGLDDLVGTWYRLGLTTLGALASLPHGQVLARFGPLGDWAWRLAQGRDVRVNHIDRPEGEVGVDVVLDPPVDNIERATFAARTVAERLYDVLAARGLGYTRLEVQARTENGAELTRTWRVEGIDAAGVVDRVRWQLEGWLGGRSGTPPASALAWLRIVAHDAAPAGTYHPTLWGAARGAVIAQRAAERVDTLLRSEGEQGVLIPVEQGGRDPRSRIRLVAWGDEAVPARPMDAPWPGRLPDPAPATLYAEPPPAELRDASGTPVRVDIRLRPSGEPAFLTLADGGTWAIAAWAGMWPVAERWWAGQGRRLYAQVLLGEAASPSRRRPPRDDPGVTELGTEGGATAPAVGGGGVGQCERQDGRWSERRGDRRGERRGERQGDRRGEGQGERQGDRRGEGQGDRRGEGQGERQGDRRGEGQGERQGDRRGEGQGEQEGEKPWGEQLTRRRVGAALQLTAGDLLLVVYEASTWRVEGRYD